MKTNWPAPAVAFAALKTPLPCFPSTASNIQPETLPSVKKTIACDQISLRFQATRPALYTLGTTPLIQKNTDLLLIPIYQETSSETLLQKQFSPVSASASKKSTQKPGLFDLAKLDAKFDNAVSHAIQNHAFSGKPKELLIIPRPTHLVSGPKQLILMGLGQAEKLTPNKLKLATSKALQQANPTCKSHIAIQLPDAPTWILKHYLEAIMNGVNQANQKNKESTPAFRQVDIMLPAKDLKQKPIPQPNRWISPEKQFTRPLEKTLYKHLKHLEHL